MFRQKIQNTTSSNKHKNQQLKESQNTTSALPIAQDGVVQNVLELQRVIGNHRTRQFIEQNGGAKPKSNLSVVQRAETGIKTTVSTNHFTKAIFDYCQDQANQTKTVADFKTFLADSVNFELKGAGSQPIVIVNGAPGASGEFDFSTWAIELNSGTAFPGATTVADLTDNQISETANTIYHEARHSEQWFRIARNRAGKALAQDASEQERQTAANTIANDMDIPANVALEACKRPLYASWLSKFGGGTDQKVDEAEAWDASVYGANADYRNDIVLGDVNDDAEALQTHLQAAVDAFPSNFSTLSAKKQKPILDTVKAEIQAARPIKDRLVAAKAGVVQDEINRLNAIGNKTANDTLMLNHLTVVKNKIARIEAKWSRTKQIKIKAASTAADELKDELYQAYLDLPEEADAWPTGDAVSTQYEALLNAVPTN